MDGYPDCLYQYVVGHMEAEATVNLIGYSRCRSAQDMAWSAPEEALPHEQIKLAEDYRSAWTELRYQKERLLFQKAVSLGKWMVQA